MVYPQPGPPQPPRQWPGPPPRWAVPQPAYPPPYSAHLPERPRRTWQWPILTALLVISALVALCGAGAAVAAARQGSEPVSVTFVGQMAPQARDRALQAILDRRAAAVKAHDKAAFMADVDSTDAAFARIQEQEFDNLGKLPFGQFKYTLETNNNYDALVDAQLRARFHTLVRAPAVSVLYQLQGLDSQSVAAPWTPVLGLRGDRWLLAAELSDKNLPTGAGGQPWDGGPITLVRSNRVLAVLSAEDGGRSERLLKMAELSLDRVAAVRKGGWAGKILVTAVQDRKIFDAYFADSPDRVAQVAAIAVPYYTQVPAWHAEPEYAATRVVFNPDQLTADENELFHDLTHEFTHAAMGPVTTGFTPSWLVEGLAEYVPFKTEKVPSSYLHRVLDGLKTDALPEDDKFYDEPRNYILAWLACRLIAERFGEAKLLTLYEAFRNTPAQFTVLPQVLGISLDAFTAMWSSYVTRARTSTLS